LLLQINLVANNDTLKNNAIYVNATKCIADDILGSGNTYIAGGYWRTFNKFRIDVGGGYIVHHSIKATGILSINAESMTGFYAVVEADRIFKKHIYLGCQFIYRRTISLDGTFDKVEVIREATSAILKFGCIYTNKKHFGIDVGFGVGVKYISSFNDRGFEGVLKEFPSGKNYNSGSGFYPAILALEIKLLKTF
jgi:hypothetical protein